MDPELERISENLKRLAAGKATPAQLEAYLQSEGMSRAQYSASVDAGRLIPRHELAPQFRGGAAGNPEMTAGEMGRVMAAGLLPGFSDEVIGVVAGLLDGNRSIADATADERNILASARAKGGSTALEMLTGFATGTGLAKLATKGIPGLSRAASILTGGLAKGAPASVLGGIGQGAKSGGTVGAIAGAGNADGGNLWDRAVGALKGGAGGAAVGGLAAGLITLGANMVNPANFNQADITRIFPEGVSPRDQRRAVGELSDAMRRGGVEVPDARAAAASMQAGGVNPMLADVGGSSMQGDMTLLDQFAQTRGGGVSKVFEKTLVPRELERSTRRAAAIPAATGRPTPSFPDYVEKLKAQKRALDDIMFARARREAETYVRTNGRFETPKELADALKNPAFAAHVDQLEAGMERGRASTRLGATEKFKNIFETENGAFLLDDNGDRIVKKYLDPITLANLSHDLGETSTAAYAAKQGALGKDFGNVKKMTDRLLDEIPTFREANAVSRRMNQRIEAAEEGYKRAVSGKPGAVTSSRKKYSEPKIELPKDVQKLLASEEAPEILRGRRSLGPAWSDYEAGAQSARVDPLLTAKNPTRANAVVAPSRDQLLFGPEAAAKIQLSDEAEAMAARTAAMSPSAQGRIAPNRGITPEQRAMETVTAGVRSPIRFGGGGTGVVLGIIDAGSRAMRFGVPMSPQRMTGIAHGMAGDAAPALNLIDQIRAASNTPVRRGLLGGSGFMAGGLLGDIWNDR